MDKYEKAKQFYLDLKKENRQVIATDAVIHHMANLITRVAELERKKNK
ncbi:hypothetical protein GI584_14385 [Gracilibacillus salitolerans]|uniref:Uncharacterized protein n=1 Tax=Gracilibacillus salitolerans TaxID=2663022 RepID=A0A5Q2TMS7_9BACI|nr:hypothetical protein [Gracilibacillus salitolerans]QGH35160.1 hypothetical protein GI584_14385 [Gracilibacillus salitolerans]